MGRPTALTPEVGETIVTAVRAGMYPEQAAVMAGVTGRTYYLWMAKGRHDAEVVESGDYPSIDESHTHDWKGDRSGSAQCWCGHTRYSQLLQDMKTAEAKAEFTAMAEVRNAFAGNWQAAMTYLERRFPARWSRRDRSTVTVTNEEPAQPEAMADPEMPMRERLARTMAIIDRTSTTD